MVLINLQVLRRLGELISPEASGAAMCHIGQMTEIQF